MLQFLDKHVEKYNTWIRVVGGLSLLEILFLVSHPAFSLLPSALDPVALLLFSNFQAYEQYKFHNNILLFEFFGKPKIVFETITFLQREEAYVSI